MVAKAITIYDIKISSDTKLFNCSYLTTVCYVQSSLHCFFFLLIIFWNHNIQLFVICTTSLQFLRLLNIGSSIDWNLKLQINSKSKSIANGGEHNPFAGGICFWRNEFLNFEYKFKFVLKKHGVRLTTLDLTVEKEIFTVESKKIRRVHNVYII